MEMVSENFGRVSLENILSKSPHRASSPRLLTASLRNGSRTPGFSAGHQTAQPPAEHPVISHVTVVIQTARDYSQEKKSPFFDRVLTN